jgi:hypothetical protein
MIMMSLHGQILIKLDRKKLDRETTFIQHEDLAGILLNGVNHIYGRISVSRERERTNNNDKVPEGINDVIDGLTRRAQTSRRSRSARRPTCRRRRTTGGRVRRGCFLR